MFQTPSVMMTPPTPMIPTKRRQIDPTLATSPVEIVENSPAYFQSLRNKQRIAMLERIQDSGGNGSSPVLPPMLPNNTTPIRDPKLRTPFKVPFIDRLKKATSE
jgi:hypothetical protein